MKSIFRLPFGALAMTTSTTRRNGRKCKKKYSVATRCNLVPRANSAFKMAGAILKAKRGLLRLRLQPVAVKTPGHVKIPCKTKRDKFDALCRTKIPEYQTLLVRTSIISPNKGVSQEFPDRKELNVPAELKKNPLQFS